MSKLPRASISKLPKKSLVSRPSVSRPSVSRPSVSRLSAARPSTVGSKTQVDVKSNASNNIKEILEYLIENDYPSVLTKKNLMNPTEATFKAIFKFIIKDFYPDFECPRLANDIINLMNAFEYPYLLKESHFTPIGSPHSWPHLLEVLAFLCNIARVMEFEKENVSQIITINARDEDKAEEELNHQVAMAKCYREYQTLCGDPNTFIEKYLQELDVEGTVALLEKSNKRVMDEVIVIEETNRKFPDIKAEFNAKLNKLKTENNELEEDKNCLIACIEEMKVDYGNLVQECEEKGCILDQLKEEAILHQNEVGRLEEVIGEQPPQHEVQVKKQYFIDLTAKTDNLKEENSTLNEEISIKQVCISNQQRELKERIRKMLEEVKFVLSDEIKFETDKAIDNKSIIQLNAIIEKLKKKIVKDKEEAAIVSDQLYDLKMLRQGLEDDLRLTNNSVVQAKDSLSQKEVEYQDERKRMIMESNSTSEKVKETRKTIEELRHQLADIDSEDVISSKISEEKSKISRTKEELDIYRSMRKHRTNELLFLYKDMNNELSLAQRLLQLKNEE